MDMQMQVRNSLLSFMTPDHSPFSFFTFLHRASSSETMIYVFCLTNDISLMFSRRGYMWMVCVRHSSCTLQTKLMLATTTLSSPLCWVTGTTPNTLSSWSSSSTLRIQAERNLFLVSLVISQGYLIRTNFEQLPLPFRRCPCIFLPKWLLFGTDSRKQPFPCDERSGFQRECHPSVRGRQNVSTTNHQHRRVRWFLLLDRRT